MKEKRNIRVRGHTAVCCEQQGKRRALFVIKNNITVRDYYNYK